MKKEKQIRSLHAKMMRIEWAGMGAHGMQNYSKLNQRTKFCVWTLEKPRYSQRYPNLLWFDQTRRENERKENEKKENGKKNEEKSMFYLYMFG